MRGNAHVRFGGRAGETEPLKGGHCASVRPYYVKAHDGARVVSMAALVATGVALTGERRVLGLELAAGNDEGSAWNSMAARNSPIRSGLTRMETNTASTIRGSLGAQQVGQRGRTAPRPSWEAARLRPRRPVG